MPSAALATAFETAAMWSSGESDHESGARGAGATGAGATGGGAFLSFFFFLLFVRPPRRFSASGSTVPSITAATSAQAAHRMALLCYLSYILYRLSIDAGSSWR